MRPGAVLGAGPGRAGPAGMRPGAVLGSSRRGGVQRAGGRGRRGGGEAALRAGGRGRRGGSNQAMPTYETLHEVKNMHQLQCFFVPCIKRSLYSLINLHMQKKQDAKGGMSGQARRARGRASPLPAAVARREPRDPQRITPPPPRPPRPPPPFSSRNPPPPTPARTGSADERLPGQAGSPRCGGSDRRCGGCGGGGGWRAGWGVAMGRVTCGAGW
jgi:hypothetical protein